MTGSSPDALVLTELGGGDGAATSTVLALAGVHGGWLEWLATASRGRR